MPYNRLDYEEPLMTVLTAFLTRLRSLEDEIITMSTASIENALAQVIRMRTPTFRLADRTIQKLEARRMETIHTLRAALLDVRMLHSAHSGITHVRRTAFMMVGDHARALSGMASVMRSAAVNRTVPLEVVRWIQWHIGFEMLDLPASSVARGAILGAPACYVVNRDTHAEVVELLPPALEVEWYASGKTLAERQAEYKRRWPKPRYPITRMVTDDQWPLTHATAPNCRNCGEHTLVYGQRLTLVGGNRMCGSCASQVRSCGACGERSHDLVWMHAPPEGAVAPYRRTALVRSVQLCSQCRTSHAVMAVDGMYMARTVAQSLLDTSFKQYSYQPEQYTIYSAPHEVVRPDSLCFGIELECGHHFDRNGSAEMRVLESIAYPDIYFKRDGSIGSGFEIVAQPLTWRHWNAGGAERWRQRLDTLKAAGVRSFNHPNCGMHVHLSADAFLPTQMLRLFDLVYGAPDLFQRLSQRSVFSYCSFQDTAVSNSVARRRAVWTRFLKKRVSDGRKTTAFRASVPANDRSVPDRNVALSLSSSKPTLEVRMFRGTLHFPSFAKNIELCHAMHAFSAATTASDALTLAVEFLRFTYSHEKQYPHLTAFLDKWYAAFRPAKKAVPVQHAIVRPPTQFEFAAAVASAS